MWVVKGKTVSGKDVEYKVAAGKDTEKAFVLAMAFQEHGKVVADDDLTAESEVTWTSDNVHVLPTVITLKVRRNYGVDKRIKKGEWERHSTRAYRTLESATEALESAASEYPNDIFRIVETETASHVRAVSKNGLDVLGTADGDNGVIEGQTAIEVKEGDASATATPVTPKRTPKPKPNAA